MPNLNVGLASVIVAIFSLNAFADQTAFHLGTYSALYNHYTNNSDTARRNTLDSLDSNMASYGVALNGCDSSAGTLAVQGSGSFCTMAHWYNTNYGYSDRSVFCFTSQDACFKFSGRLVPSGLRGNVNSTANLTQGYKLSDTGVTYLKNTTTPSTYQRNVTITNDEFFQCLSDCPSKTGWTAVYNSDGTTIKYEQNLSKYCSSNTASTCSNVSMSSAHSFRCPEYYYNQQGTSATVTVSPSSLTCKPCPTTPLKRDGTRCALNHPSAGAGSQITSCGLLSGCESYDDTGDYLLAGQCFYESSGSSTSGPDTSTSGVTTAVKELISEEVGIDISDYPMDTKLGSGGLGIDSIGAVNIATSLEEMYDITIEPEYYSNFTTIQELVDFILYLIG